jgi:hypothetical protein
MPRINTKALRLAVASSAVAGVAGGIAAAPADATQTYYCYSSHHAGLGCTYPGAGEAGIISNAGRNHGNTRSQFDTRVACIDEHASGGSYTRSACASYEGLAKHYYGASAPEIGQARVWNGVNDYLDLIAGTISQ